jgi:hypothetical protein
VLSRLHELDIGAHKALELYLAGAGLKVTRTVMDDAELALVLPVLLDSGVEILLSKEKFLLGSDAGKGGYGNTFGAEVSADHPQGYFCVYIGRDLTELSEARDADETGNDDKFGELLGIPACCRSHFSSQKERFSSEQNDPTHCIKQDGEVVPWCSHFPMYFGYGLFSHFPCSVDCAATKKLAMRNEKLLREVSPELANTFVRYQFLNYLYSEYDGIFAFDDMTPCPESTTPAWAYDNKRLEATSSALLSDIIFSCDSISLAGGEIAFRRDGMVRLLADASNFRLAFHNESRL